MRHTHTRPSFVTNFSCIGSDCEDSCCYGWGISIDKKSFKKTLAHPELKELATQALRKVKKSDTEWARVTLNDDGACRFLDEQNLCQIHTKAGHELLSNTCKTYPRMSHFKDGDRYESLSLSCPEAARVILFNSNPFHLEQITVNHNHAFQSSPMWAKKAHDYSMQLLVKSDMQLEHALTAIGIIMKKTEDVSKGLLGSESIGSMYQQLLILHANGELKRHFDGFNQDTNTQQMHAFTSIQLWLHTNKPSRGRKRFEQIHQAILDMMEDESINMEHINTAWHQIAKPALTAHPDLFSRYLIYYVYHMNFPQVDALTPSQAFRVMLVDFFMLRCYLSVIAAKNNGLSKSDIILCFQVYHTSRQHKANYSQYVIEILNRAKFDDLPAILTLLS
ncbi:MULTISPECIES: flagellin lysine-N-methylase [unclassified Shewanella]|uniref:flagellin lysine-N-methylase n=1 Tax=unclassified Shewanella TaxID=196818 RepID=UPI001BC7CEF2|nr:MULTISPECIES: flagellin lysine-N-methylase [unclassified Shewanella]GIU14702.1 flagellar biosynthesis protein [Shewanella sp. MBTL60-112-B1]GIU37759.1 flagellar biosynthesis protein [Shewanella sp. MBTL60-112-B2]